MLPKGDAGENGGSGNARIYQDWQGPSIRGQHDFGVKMGIPQTGRFPFCSVPLKPTSKQAPCNRPHPFVAKSRRTPLLFNSARPFCRFCEPRGLWSKLPPPKKQNLTTEVQNNTNLFLQSGEHWPLERHNTDLLANTPCYHVLTELLWLLLGSLLKPNLNTHSSLPPFQPPAGLWVTKGLLKHIMHVRNSKSLT